MIALVSMLRVLLILLLAIITISLLIAIGRPTTGATEKLVALALIAGCIFAAAQVSKFATRTRERLQRR